MKRWPVWVAVFVLPWLWATGAQAQSIPYSHDFEATDTAFHLFPTGDTLAWKTNQSGGVSGSRCLVSEYVTNSAGANAEKYYTSLRLPLVAGNTYRFSFKTRVQYAHRRKALLAIHTSAERSGSTLLHDFDTLTATESYQAYSHDFGVETTGSYHLIYYGESVSAPKNCYWYTDEVAVTLVNTPPTSCTLSSPANNSYYNPGQSVALVALPTDAQNNLSKVEWYSGGTKVAEDATADAFGYYTASFVPQNGGAQTITAKAIDSYGAALTSNSRNITVRYMPQVALTNLADHSDYYPGSQPVSATATDPDGTVQRVVFYVNGDPVGVDSSAPYQCAVPLVYDENQAAQTLTAKATDNDGLEGTQTFTLFVKPGPCSLTTPNGQLRQALCSGDSLMLVAEGGNNAQTLQWYHRPDATSSWEALAGADFFRLQAKAAGHYQAVWTYANAAVCTTAVDTVQHWNPVDSLAFDTRACAATLTQRKANLYPNANYGSGYEEYSYQWEILPATTTNTLPATSTDAWESTRFTHTRPGLHTVTLTITHPETGCISADTVVVTIDSLHVTADTIISYGGQPAIAVAHASGGTEPYSYTWSSVDTCLTGNCDTVVVSNFSQPVSVMVTDGVGCGKNEESVVQISGLHAPARLDVISRNNAALRLRWSGGNGNRVIVVAKKGAPFDFFPKADSLYAGDSVYGGSASIGATKILYAGPYKDSTLWIMDLDSASGYYFKLYSYFERPATGGFTYSDDFANAYGHTTGELKNGCNPVYVETHEEAEERKLKDTYLVDYIREKMASGVPDLLPPGGSYVIPVVFHFVGVNESALACGIAMDNCRIQSALNSLNDYFGNHNDQAQGRVVPGGKKVMNIKFCMTQTPPPGITWFGGRPGIMKYIRDDNVVNTIQADIFDGDNTQVHNQYKALINTNFPPEKYLNVVVIESIKYNNAPVGGGLSVAGLYVGGQVDQVYVTSRFFGSRDINHYDNCSSMPSESSLTGLGTTLAHEVGHYLGLYHPFDNTPTCPPPNVNCDVEGDQVCDTPPVLEAYYGCGNENSCESGVPRDKSNLMDYTGDPCKFTFTATTNKISQKTKMHANLETKRQFLWSNNNLYSNGIYGPGSCSPSTQPFVDISYDNASYTQCAIQGASVTLNASVVGGASQHFWKIYKDWDCETGSGTLVHTVNTGTANTLVFPGQSDPVEVGTYTVVLTVFYGQTGESVKTTECDFFSFVNCDASQVTMGQWYLGNKSIMGFTPNGPIQVWPSPTKNVGSHFTYNENGVPRFYIDANWVRKLNGSPACATPLNQELSITRYHVKLFDVLEISPTRFLILSGNKIMPADPGLADPGYNIKLGLLTITEEVFELSLFEGITSIEDIKFIRTCLDDGKIYFVGTKIDQNKMTLYSYFEATGIDEELSLTYPGDRLKCLTISPDQSKIVSEQGHLFHFDGANETFTLLNGSLPNLTSRTPPVFSSDSRYVYFFHYTPSHWFRYSISRYAVTSGCGLTYQKTRDVITKSPTYLGPLNAERGPDERIYFPNIQKSPSSGSSYNSPLIASIENVIPQTAGDDIVLNLKKVRMNGSVVFPTFAIDPFVSSYNEDNKSILTCNNCRDVDIYSNYCSPTIRIDFGDGQSEFGKNATTHFYDCNTQPSCTYTISIVETAGGHDIVKDQKTIMVNLPVAPTIIGISSLFCGQLATYYISQPLPFQTYEWAFQPVEDGQPAGDPIPISSLDGGISISYIFKKSGYLMVTYAENDCKAVVQLEILVSPTVTFTISPPSPLTICSGSTTHIGMGSLAPEAVFSWMVVSSNNLEGATAGSGAVIEQQLAAGSESPNPGTANYTITASVTGCLSSQQSYLVTVLPKPELTLTGNPVDLCSGGSFQVGVEMAETINSFSWTATPTENVGGASGCVGCSQLNQTLSTTNGSASTGTVTYKVYVQTSLCTVEETFSVRVLPPITSRVGKDHISVCSGVPFSYPLPNVEGVAYTWDANVYSGSSVTGLQGCASGCGYYLDQNVTSTEIALNNGSTFASFTVYQTTEFAACEATIDIEVVRPTLQIEGLCTEAERSIRVVRSEPVYDMVYNWYMTSSQNPNGIKFHEGPAFDVFLGNVPQNVGLFVKGESHIGCTTDPYYFRIIEQPPAPGTTLVNQNIYLRGDELTLDNVTLDQTTIRFMGMPGTSFDPALPGGTVAPYLLHVATGATLTVANNSLLTSGCQNMWGGVRMGQGSELHMDHSTIAHADVGVASTPMLNDKIAVDYCQFLHCRIGIQLVDVDGNNTIPNSLHLKHSTFLADAVEMKEPLSLQRNRTLSGLNNTTGRFITETGLYVGLAQGIAENEVDHNTFQNCHTGIYFAMRPRLGQVVKQSTFINCAWRSIFSPGYNSVFEGNQFELPASPAVSTTWQGQRLRGLSYNSSLASLPSYGIEVDGRQNGVVSGFMNVLGNQCSSTGANHLGSGVYSNLSCKVEGNTFADLQTGVHLYSDPYTLTPTLTLTGNTFADNRTAILLENEDPASSSPLTVNFTLKCNEFINTPQTTTSFTRKGLVIGNGVALSGPIGNSGLDDNETPNGNVWPVDASNSTTPWPVPPNNTLPVATILAGWVPPANWTSLQNDNPNAVLEYWAFDNEYVRPSSDNTPNNIVSRRPSGQNDVMVYPEGDPEPTTPGIDFVEMCSPNLPDVFPLPPLRPALPNANDVTATLATIGKQTGQVALGDAVPNPAGTTTRIPVFVPVGHQGSVWLQVFDLTGRAVRWQTQLKQSGSQWVDVSVSDFPAGVYGYALSDNGKPVGNRKLVVIR